MVSIKLILMSLFVCFLLQGCIVISYPYFRNLTEAPVSLELHSFRGAGVIKENSIRYIDSVLAINKYTFGYLRDSIKLQRLSDGIFHIDVPAHTTAMIPYFMQVNSKDTIIFRTGTMADTLTAGELKIIRNGAKYFYFDFAGNKLKK